MTMNEDTVQLTFAGAMTIVVVTGLVLMLQSCFANIQASNRLLGERQALCISKGGTWVQSSGNVPEMCIAPRI